MAKYLTEETIDQLDSEYLVTRQHVGDLLLACLTYEQVLTVEKARKYCRYGLCRRISHIHKSLDRLYLSFLREAKGEEIDDDARYEQTAFLNLFLIDVSAALDNLAHVILSEKNITLQYAQISLMKDATRSYMPPALIESLIQYSAWLEHLRSFRDPVAHRISPYVPPYIQSPSGKKIYDAYYVHDFDVSPSVPLHPQVIADAKTLCEIVGKVVPIRPTS